MRARFNQLLSHLSVGRVVPTEPERRGKSQKPEAGSQRPEVRSQTSDIRHKKAGAKGWAEPISQLSTLNSQPRPHFQLSTLNFQLAAALLIAAAFFLTACDNMKKQPNNRPLTPSSQFPDGSSARQPPAHTIAVGDRLSGDVFTTGYVNGQPTDTFPVPVMRALVERGRERFDIYCAVCHGEDGYGRGIIVRRGFPPPPSLHEDRLRNSPIGHFFEVMTKGYGVMYPYADRVEPGDRWAIAAYIRALQRSQHATLADAPTEARAHLSSAP